MLLAGIELVDIQEVVRLQPTQIAADVGAFQAAGADGLALSWDLWHIPRERLELVRTAWARLASDLPERALPQAPLDFSI
jgi:acyl-CoA synthetase (NDP forming)